MYPAILLALNIHEEPEALVALFLFNFHYIFFRTLDRKILLCLMYLVSLWIGESTPPVEPCQCGNLWMLNQYDNKQKYMKSSLLFITFRRMAT